MPLPSFSLSPSFLLPHSLPPSNPLSQSLSGGPHIINIFDVVIAKSLLSCCHILILFEIPRILYKHSVITLIKELTRFFINKLLCDNSNPSWLISVVKIKLYITYLHATVFTIFENNFYKNSSVNKHKLYSNLKKYIYYCQLN